MDITETGSSLRANNLRVIDEVLVSTTRLIASHEAWADPARRHKIEALDMLLQGAIAARSKVGLKLNVPRSELDAVLALIGQYGEHSPTVSPLSDESVGRAGADPRRAHRAGDHPGRCRRRGPAASSRIRSTR